MSLITTALLALTLPLTHAAPSPPHPRRTGQMTWYSPGLGACGMTHGEGDLIAAVSAPLYDTSNPCGRRIRVTGPAGSVDVVVVDRCGGCGYDDLDLSPVAFQQAVGDLGLGRKEATWKWA
ncbi:hypothetical protein AK830_g12370 [Neonectria ditissima]|uniref:RlpA-like protein double-psi beta-barrel domain-containing protein n=1 Tax=Neonectria ditissima TaxID=78410 RepID=A0A0P7B0Q4_9HYPO|nr:hypothetical protein AK830_g12370 [Neonectria ditissima]